MAYPLEQHSVPSAAFYTRDPYTPFGRVLWHATWLVWRPLLQAFCHFKVEGQEHCRGLAGPLIVMANHTHYLDSYTLSAAMPFPNRIFPIRFLTDVFYIKMPVVGWIIRGYGVVPAEPGAGMEKVLERPQQILRRGGVMGFFPEGGFRKKKGEEAFFPARPGIAYLGTVSDAAILPVAVRGHANLTPLRFLLRRAHITVVFGKPFTMKEIAPNLHPASSKEEFTHAAELAMARVKELYTVKAP